LSLSSLQGSSSGSSGSIGSEPMSLYSLVRFLIPDLLDLPQFIHWRVCHLRSSFHVFSFVSLENLLCMACLLQIFVRFPLLP
jgi:hypothetical protein